MTKEQILKFIKALLVAEQAKLAKIRILRASLGDERSGVDDAVEAKQLGKVALLIEIATYTGADRIDLNL